MYLWLAYGPLGVILSVIIWLPAVFMFVPCFWGILAFPLPTLAALVPLVCGWLFYSGCFEADANKSYETHRVGADFFIKSRIQLIFVTAQFVSMMTVCTFMFCFTRDYMMTNNALVGELKFPELHIPKIQYVFDVDILVLTIEKMGYFNLNYWTTKLLWNLALWIQMLFTTTEVIETMCKKISNPNFYARIETERAKWEKEKERRLKKRRRDADQMDRAIAEGYVLN